MILAHALTAPPTLGPGRLVCLDGPSGSGKTTLAAALARPGAAVVHLDDLYEGWDGLGSAHLSVGSLLASLAAGRPGTYRRWDWLTSGWGETVTVPPADLLILDGAGCWHPSYAALVTTLVWVEAPQAVRRARGLARDGEAMGPGLARWWVAEAAHFARLDTAAHADFVVDQTGAVSPAAGRPAPPAAVAPGGSRSR